MRKRLTDRAKSPALLSVLLLTIACRAPVSLHPVGDESGAADPQQGIASQVPDTDIFLFEIDANRPELVTDFRGNITNRTGYDNQPRFIPGTNNLLFTSIVDGTQSDIYFYHDDTRLITRRTDTSLSEYSPTPNFDGTFTTVVVEEDGTQRLWHYNHAGYPLAIIRDDITGVGYHAFHDEKTLALFIVADPVRLDIANRFTQDVRTVASGIGRSLHAIPHTDAFSFVHHGDDRGGVLSSWNIRTGEISEMVEMPADVEDMVWLPDGRALTVAAGVLMIWQEGHSGWQIVQDLRKRLPCTASRLAVNEVANRLAIVCELE